MSDPKPLPDDDGLIRPVIIGVETGRVSAMYDGDGFPPEFMDDLMACVRLGLFGGRYDKYDGRILDSLPPDLALVYERALNWLILRRALVSAGLDQAQREAVLSAYAAERGDSVPLDKLLAKRANAAETKRDTKARGLKDWKALWKELRPNYGPAPLKGTERTRLLKAMIARKAGSGVEVPALRNIFRVKDGWT